MTPEERADVILWLVDVDKKLLKDGVFEAVVLKIRAAVEIAYADGVQDCVKNHRAIKAEAFEEAARIAETYYEWQDPGDEESMSETIARRIRSRAREAGTRLELERDSRGTSFCRDARLEGIEENS